MTDPVVMQRAHSRARRIGRWAAVMAAVSTGVFVAWFLGLDWLWAVAMVLAIGSVGLVLATMTSEEPPAWDPPGRETPRGIRLAIPMMEESLAACDRLARPLIARHMRAVVIEERDDRLARGRMLRQMRALLVAELRARGVDPVVGPHDAVVALLGSDALSVLDPNDDNPLTTTAIVNCLDAVERLHTESLPSQ
ncbi:hypothetical protein [Gemmatimonas aurantiaca]|uniref:hypothetical protein n=1 Tax=Gemmatimonas aurantiaca TaxID=173480 RepID=UPI00301D6ECB